HIALLTDFGLQDNFAGVMEGMIYRINPHVTVSHITHGIKPQDLFQASFLLRHSYKHFPEKTIFVCVVDPGVGTARDVIVVRKKATVFMAPDNGILSFLTGRDTEYFKIVPNKFIPPPASTTFHGRDIFSPLAALLSKGISINKLARTVKSIKHLDIPSPVKGQKTVKGKIIYIDRFGNCISNVSRDLFTAMTGSSFTVEINNLKIYDLSSHYQIPSKAGVLFNSFNLLEIFVPNGNASQELGITLNMPFTIKI
ncbi:MAG: SAM-dependent chlorinase/fluorinase, partial [Spirochaetes bacterium]|nr:SAM-dependent chlorinase/fluorinase [Spirochaetota bacterium]